MTSNSILVVVGLLGLALGHKHAGDTYRGPHHPRGQTASHQHYRPTAGGGEGEGAPKLTQDENLLHDTDHIREDLGDWMTEEATKLMTPEELEFHYFKLHDFDNNTQLDGLEILQAIHHTMHHHNNKENNDNNSNNEEPSLESQQELPEPTEDLDYFVELIDRVLAEDDMNNDGYLSYVEYVMGRKKDERSRSLKNSHNSVLEQT